jgi:diaminopimelate decarboxylase
LLELIETKLFDVKVLNLGGGFKVVRGEGDKETDISDLAK